MRWVDILKIGKNVENHLYIHIFADANYFEVMEKKNWIWFGDDENLSIHSRFPPESW